MALMGAVTSRWRGESAAAVLDFAVAQILRDDTALGALPAVLARTVAAFGLRAAPADGQSLCALALIGDAPAPDAEGTDEGAWDAEIRATAHALAAIVATQIRHANDIATLERSHAELADQTERLNCLIAWPRWR